MLSFKAKILLYANNLAMLGEGLFGPLYAVFAEKIGGSVLEITWAWAVYLIVTGITIVFVGAFSDRKGWKKKMLIWGYGVAAVFTFMYLWVDAPWKLYVVEGGLGFAAALSTPTWYALFSKYQHDEERGWSWGIAQGQSKLLLAFSMVLGGFVVSYFSFFTLFVAMGIIQVLATIVLFGLFQEVSGPNWERVKKGSSKKIVQKRKIEKKKR